WEKHRGPSPARPGVCSVGPEVRDIAGREGAMRALVDVECEAELLEVVHALSPAGRLAGHLDGGQAQGDHEGDDAGEHEELDQRERTRLAGRAALRTHRAPPASGVRDRHRNPTTWRRCGPKMTAL